MIFGILISIVNQINSINDGIKIWNSLEINEKEKYLRISHKYYLAFKYKDLIYQKKIRRIFPRKPFDAFQFFLNEKKGIKIPEGNNTVIYWREKYNELDDEVKKKYIKQYNIAIKEYKSKLDTFKDKVFDFPKSPKNPFSFYISCELNELSKKNEKIDIKETFENLTRNWYINEVEKKIYEEMANKDKIRYKNEIIEFEKFGYYSKYDINSNTDDINSKYESSPKKSKKRTVYNSNDNKRKKKCLNSKRNNHINNSANTNNIKKGKLQLEL